MSTSDGGLVIQGDDNGTADHKWRARHRSGGYFRIQCANGGRVLGVSGASTARDAQVVIWGDNGTNDHLWRFI